MPTGNLPESGKKLWEKVYNDAKAAGDSEEKAAKKAWGAVHQAGWKKDANGKWVKSSLAEFSMRIDRANYDEASNERRIRIVASDTDEDKRKDNMSLELFQDFIQHIKNNDPVPEEYRSDFWKGGEPYISVSHYPDMDGKYAPGIIDSTYIDGNCLKSKGKFEDTPLGRKCFEVVCSELYGNDKNRPDKVRISIAFLDYMHKHKSNGFTFDRMKEELPFCPECLKEALTGESQGLVFLRGQLIHEALTRVPVNTRTSMEVDKSMANKIKTRKDDAASIVGDELAEELEEEVKLVGKSDALVIKSEDDPIPDVTASDAVGNTPIEKMDVVPVAVVNPISVDVTEPYEPPKPFGGATSLKDAIALQEAKQTMWNIEDLWYMVQTVKDNIMASEEVTDKGKALGNLLEEFKKEIKTKSEVEGLSMTKEEIAEIIKSTVAELLPKPTEPTVVTAHPLDATFTAFKSKFDEVIRSEATEDEKLLSMQEPFNVLGNEIRTVVKGSIKPKETTPEAKAQSDLAKALSDALNPFMQRLELVATQLSTPIPDRVAPIIPQRRSISPSIFEQPAQPVVKSETPNLRKIIDRTVP